MPVVTWLIWKRYKGSPKGEFWRLVNWPLIFVGTYNVPPATVSLFFFAFNSWVGVGGPMGWTDSGSGIMMREANIWIS